MPDGPAVKAVVFDLGGVLTVSPFAALDAYGAELGLPVGCLGVFFRGDSVFAKVETGEVSAREFFKSVCRRVEELHGVRVDIRRLAAAAEAGGELNPDMLALVRELHGRVALGLLTNNVKEAVGWRRALPHDLFDVIVDSSAVGLRKPDPRIYELVIERLGCLPAEAVFVDDFEENLPPARALGMVVVAFDGVDSCRRALEKLQVL